MPRWRPSRRAASATLVLLLVVASVGGTLTWRAAGKLLAPCQREVGAPPDGFAVEDVSFQSDSGSLISGWYHPGAPDKGVVVIAHGIRGSRLASVPRAKLFAEAGFSTLLFDLRCHGESPGGRITLGSRERFDIQAAVRLAKQKNPGEPVAVVGFSLGGAATALAAPLDVDAVVLEAVFPTIEAAIRNRTDRDYGWLSPLASQALLLQLEPRTGIHAEDLRPIDKVAELGCPVLIVGGTIDPQTTPEDTRAMFHAAAEPKELAWFPGLGHRNYARWAPDRYREEVVRLVERWLAGEPPKPPVE